jgi:uncharacterized YigZ family protein
MKYNPIPAQQIRIEKKVLNSRFIATIGPVLTVEEAKDFIIRNKIEFADASHNVPAFLIGHGDSIIAHCNDDGEPSGTAGRPILAVLKGSGIGDAAIVVTRYFGGTKLGKGGLARAYGDAAKAALKAVPKAVKAATHSTIFVVEYSTFENVRIIIKKHHGRIINEEFGVNVTITCQFLVDLFPAFQADLQELTRGLTYAEILTTDESTIIPLKEYPTFDSQENN